MADANYIAFSESTPRDHSPGAICLIRDHQERETMHKKIIPIVLLLLGSLACTLTTDFPPPPGDITSTPWEPTSTPAPRPSDEVRLLKTEGSPAQPTATASRTCRVEVANLHLRSKPGATFSVLAYLRAGDLLILTSSTPSDAWLEVKTPGGLVGWINSTYCK